MRRWVGILIAVPIAVAAYRSLIRPWHLSWGATPEEVQQEMPGDALIQNVVSESTRTILIGEQALDVWPWVVQIGQGRGGLYSYEWLENLIGSDIHNASHILPEDQDLHPGDTIHLAAPDRYPEARLIVDSIVPDRSLVLRSPNLEPGLASDAFAYSWSFLLEPVDHAVTRLVVRSRYQGPPLVVALFELIQFVMERAMLRGIRDRAERKGLEEPRHTGTAAPLL